MNNELNKVSIIVPVYNTSQYLRQCLDSILTQTYKDWECILVDDGSTDDSLRICDEYAARDQRFRVIHKENGGVSSARNRGINEASGEWITFVDSDDELYDENSLQKMISNVGQSQLVLYGIKIIFSNGNYTNPDHPISEHLNTKEFAKLLVSWKYGYMGYIAARLYRRDIVRKNHLQLAKDIFFCEDNLFCSQYICCPEVNDIYIDTTSYTYTYKFHEGSVMSTVDAGYNPKFITDFIAYQRIATLFHGAFDDEEIDSLTQRRICLSGQKILSMMKRSGVIVIGQQQYILDVLMKNKWFVLLTDSIRGYIMHPFKYLFPKSIFWKIALKAKAVQ